ncbi:MAG: phosphatase PAP2 family protein [Candidatus Methylacidiphilales bacterium]
MKEIIKQNKWFIATYFIILGVASLFLLLSNSETVTLSINQIHNPILDTLFKFATHFGEAWFGVPICIYLLIKNKNWGITASIVSILSTLITQFNKHFVFDNALRPSLLLKDYKLNFVEGVEILQYNSFPSGHTTFAFAIFTCLALFYKKPWLQIFFLLSAVIVAFSRIYLLQHFLRDTVVGSLIGFFCALICYWFIIEQKSKTIK